MIPGNGFTEESGKKFILTIIKRNISSLSNELVAQLYAHTHDEMKKRGLLDQNKE